MKILFATPYGVNAGGIARWAEHITNFYSNLDNKDCKMTLFQMGRKYEDIHKSKFGRVKNGIRDYMVYTNNLSKELKNHRYDLVHIASSASLGLFKDLLMIDVAHKRGVKVVIHFHFGRIPELACKGNWEWKLLCRVVRKADSVIVIDKESYEALIKFGFKNVFLLPNPLAPKIATIIENSDYQRTERSLLFAGHGLRTKGVYELIDACKEIPNITLKMVGPIQEEIKTELYSRCNNANWLNICGEQSFETVIKEMLSCDVFILPTYTEGFPNVILESMACGCAIVTTPVGAIPEMLAPHNGQNYGILVEPQNSEKLKEGILRMLDDAEFKRQCSKNVVERVNKRYNISIVWKQMIDVWSKTIS